MSRDVQSWNDILVPSLPKKYDKYRLNTEYVVTLRIVVVMLDSSHNAAAAQKKVGSIGDNRI